jgi:hypothetical protein
MAVPGLFSSVGTRDLRNGLGNASEPSPRILDSADTLPLPGRRSIRARSAHLRPIRVGLVMFGMRNGTEPDHWRSSSKGGPIQTARLIFGIARCRARA